MKWVSEIIHPSNIGYNPTLPGGDENAHQFLGNWSNHVLGWTKARKFPVLALRYEDMLKDPYEAFDQVVRHIGLPIDRKRLERAAQFSDFKALRYSPIYCQPPPPSN